MLPWEEEGRLFSRQEQKRCCLPRSPAHSFKRKPQRDLQALPFCTLTSRWLLQQAPGARCSSATQVRGCLLACGARCLLLELAQGTSPDPLTPSLCSWREPEGGLQHRPFTLSRCTCSCFVSHSSQGKSKGQLVTAENDAGSGQDTAGCSYLAEILDTNPHQKPFFPQKH